MSDLRILVTGSRDVPDDYFEHIDDAICDVFGYKMWWKVWDHIIVVHGDCPTGADKAAKVAIQRLISQETEYPDVFVEEAHPAEWEKYGRSAGPRRNKEMVDAGADIVLAYPKGESRGTRNCIKLAQEAGLTVVVHEL